VIRRYEHPSPGDVIPVDIKKLGRIPDGGGHRKLGRATGRRNKVRTPSNRRPGYHYLHNAVDDHSRLAYTEILTDETKETGSAFWQRAHAWFQSRGSTIQRGAGEPRLAQSSAVPEGVDAPTIPDAASPDSCSRPGPKANVIRISPERGTPRLPRSQDVKASEGIGGPPAHNALGVEGAL
jgi:hypothetical protein